MYEPITEKFEETGRCSLRAESTVLGGAQTILFVEDETFVRKVTCEVLQAAGYRVLTAKNASEAEKLYDQRRDEVDLLLTDVILPGETGLALACRLRQHSQRLKILLVTGHAEHMGLREGATEELLPKPFSSEALLRKVRQLLDSEGFGVDKKPVRHVCDNA